MQARVSRLKEEFQRPLMRLVQINARIHSGGQRAAAGPSVEVRDTRDRPS